MHKVAMFAVMLFLAGPTFARDEVVVVGSSTVFPFTEAVALDLFKADGIKVVDRSTGTVAGFRKLCEGIGEAFPDVAGASRRIRSSEYDACLAAGVEHLIEVPIGYDGIVIASQLKDSPMPLTRELLFLALSKQIPGSQGTVIGNPYKMWSDIDPALPPIKIRVLGPPKTSGTRDVFESMAIGAGCKESPAVKALNDVQRQSMCGPLREDGAFVEKGENDNEIVAALQADPNAIGVFGYSYAVGNKNTIAAHSIDGALPSEKTIGDGSYPLSRPLFLYVKGEHQTIVPPIKRFVEFYTSADIIGPDGFLTELGLVPLSAEDAARSHETARKLSKMSRP